jgi:hypothetical protein
MISVDTSMFDFADFSSAREMSAVGEEAAGMVMEQFKTMIKQKSEPQLLQGQRFVCNH